MAHINQTEKKIIAELLKPILKKYKVESTLSISNNSTISLNIKSSPIDFIGIFNENLQLKATDNIQINPYCVDRHFEGNEIALSFLNAAHDALRGANWYDNSDARSDYFDTAYYFHINIGKWDKPYILVD